MMTVVPSAMVFFTDGVAMLSVRLPVKEKRLKSALSMPLPPSKWSGPEIGADERVVADAAIELVEAGKAGERVVAGVAVEDVGGAGAVHGLADTRAAELERGLTGAEIGDAVDLEARDRLRRQKPRYCWRA